MAVHPLCSHAATFSSVITHICPPAKSWLPHSFTPFLGTHQFTPWTVNILIKRRSVRCCDETIGKQGEMRALETASCLPPPSCTRLTALAHPVSSGSRWPVVMHKWTHKGLDLALIILKEATHCWKWSRYRQKSRKNDPGCMEDCIVDLIPVVTMISSYKNNLFG